MPLMLVVVDAQHPTQTNSLLSGAAFHCLAITHAHWAPLLEPLLMILLGHRLLLQASAALGTDIRATQNMSPMLHCYAP